MKYKTNNIHTKKFIITALLVVAAAVMGTSGTIFALHNNAQSTADTSDTRDNKLVKSMFSFSDPQGWWQGATNETSMVVFDEDNIHACFVSAEYISGIVDVDAEMSKINAVLTKYGENYIMTPLGSKTLELQTNSKPLRYELRQSSVITPPGSSKLKGGQEFGYIQLSDGYIKIMGYCDTPEQLPNTMPALKAIKFDDTKVGH